MIQCCMQFELGYLGGNSYSKAKGNGNVGMIAKFKAQPYPA